MNIFLKNTFGKWFENGETKIIMFGLPCSGKTTIVYNLKLGDFIKTERLFNILTIETIEYEKLKMHLITVGDGCYIHQICKQLFPNVDGLIFVIDSSSKWEINDAREILFKFVNEDLLKNTKLLIYSNKRDIKDTLDAKKLKNVLELNKITQEWKIQNCIATTGDGLFEGMLWLSEKIENKAIQNV